MNIYIDITRCLRGDKAIAYNATVHWEMDDFDTMAKGEMDELKRRLQYEVDRTFSHANEDAVS